MKTRNAEVLGEKCVGCTSWYTGMGCTNERCPNGYKGAGSADVPCDQPCDVVNDLAKEVDELKEQVFDYTQAIGNEVVINMKLKEENDDLRAKLVALRDVTKALRGFSNELFCGCDSCKTLKINIDAALDSVKDVKP